MRRCCAAGCRRASIPRIRVGRCTWTRRPGTIRPIALGGAAREALRLPDMLETMLLRLRESLEKADRRQISESRRLDDVLDKLNTSIKTYVTSWTPRGWARRTMRACGRS